MSATETLRSLLSSKLPDFPLALELRLVAPKDVGAVLGCTRRKIELAIFHGELAAVRAGGRVYASIDAIVEWFERTQHSRRCRTPRALVADSKVHPQNRKHHGVPRLSARRMSDRKAAR
jgi:hypothetical protein